ncbi:MAG: hypothetical protein JOS17DRAFT_745501, partial [Linnemannia elongata]
MHAASQSKIFFSLSFFLSFLSFLTLSCLGQKALWTCYACNLISVSSIFIYIFCGLRIMENRPQNASATKMKNSILIPSLCTIVCLIENVVGIACT